MHRDPPICRDCAHCWARPLDPFGLVRDWHGARCSAPETPVDPVSGLSAAFCQDMRAGYVADGLCGPAGWHFRPKFSLWRWLSNLWRIET